MTLKKAEDASRAQSYVLAKPFNRQDLQRILRHLHERKTL
jgi:hypothetical protein